MRKDEVLIHIRDILARHKSMFVLGKSYIGEMEDNYYFTEEERRKIAALLEDVVGGIVENQAILSDLLQHVTEADENKIY